MKLKNLTAMVALTGMLALPLLAGAAETKGNGKDAKVKAYTLKTCPVSDEKLGEMGEPFTFTYEGREIKLCCKSCQKDFKKDPAKFIKKIEAAEKKDAKKS